jgi:subtilisin family serine protease
VLVVVAAGNQAADAAARGPAGNRGVLTVAGTTTEDKRAAFSNWGQPVDLAAPAMDVLSLRARGTDFLLYVGENPDYVAGAGVVGRDKDLYRASGTSFAAPLVSGTASLILSLRPGLTAQQVQRMLIMGADDVELPGWDQYTGAGRLNAVRSLQADPNYELYARISGVVPQRQGNQISVQVRGQAAGTQFEDRSLQIGFGETPAEWTTVASERTPVTDDGPLGIIPMSRFNRRGIWTIRLLVRDARKAERQGRAQLNLE